MMRFFNDKTAVSIRVILLLVLFYSCSASFVRAQTTQPTRISIDPTRTTHLTELFESVSILPLEQNSPALFGFFGAIIRVADDRLFITTFSQDRRMLFVYDLNGKLIQIVDKFGPGPKELGKILNFYAHDKVTLDILSAEKGQIYEFNVLENKINHSQKFSGTPPSQFVRSPDHTGYYSMKWPVAMNILKPPYNWLEKLNKDFKVTEGFLPGRHIPGKIERMPVITSSLQLFNDEIGVHKPFSDTIHSVRASRTYPAYILNFGKYKKYNEETVTARLVDQEFTSHNGVRAINFIEPKRWLLLEYEYQVSRLSLYDKDQNRLISASISKPLTRPNSSRLRLVHADNERAFFTYTTKNSRVDEFLKAEFKEGRVLNFSELDFDQLEEEETPILLVFRFKPIQE